MPKRKRLTRAEHASIESAMRTQNPDGALESITELHGFFTSIISGPVVLPSQWLTIVLGDEETRGWKNLDEASRVISLLMRFYNEIATDLNDDEGRHYSILVDVIGDPPYTIEMADDWCIGYLMGAYLRIEEWKPAFEDPRLSETIAVIGKLADPLTPGFDPVENPDTYFESLERLPECAVEIHAWWMRKFAADARGGFTPSGTIRRQSPKVGPNAACPCGSGKKYKKCCSPVRSVTLD